MRGGGHRVEGIGARPGTLMIFSRIVALCWRSGWALLGWSERAVAMAMYVRWIGDSIRVQRSADQPIP
jgi:hypothetical protein